MTGRPARHAEPHLLGWTVTGVPQFVTTDHTVAAATAAELDLIDPLPCRHDGGERVDVTPADRPPGTVVAWSCCGLGETGPR